MKVLCKKDYKEKGRIPPNLGFEKDNYYDINRQYNDSYAIFLCKNKKINNISYTSSYIFYKKSNNPFFKDYFYSPGTTMRKIRKEKLKKLQNE